jgi:hypothetical protein
LMDKWHWRCPQQIRGENNVNHSFSLFSEGTDRTSCSCTLSVSLCVSCVVFLCVSECLLSMCKASVSLPPLWVRGLWQGQFTKSVGPRGRGWGRVAFLLAGWRGRGEVNLPLNVITWTNNPKD